MVWFKTSGFCYTINTGPSLGLLLNILLLPGFMEILQFQKIVDGMDVGVGVVLGLDSCRVG